MEWDKLARQIRMYNWITLAVLGCASFFFMNAGFTLGVLLGGLLIIANFNVLQYTVRNCFAPSGVMRAGKISLVANFYFRLAIMGIIIYIVITTGWVNPVGLVLGLSIVVISIIHVGIRAAWKLSSGEAL